MFAVTAAASTVSHDTPLMGAQNRRYFHRKLTGFVLAVLALLSVLLVASLISLLSSLPTFFVNRKAAAEFRCNMHE